MLRALVFALFAALSPLPALAAPLTTVELDYHFDELGGNQVRSLLINGRGICPSGCDFSGLNVFNASHVRVSVGSGFGLSDLGVGSLDLFAGEYSGFALGFSFTAPQSFYAHFSLLGGSIDPWSALTLAFTTTNLKYEYGTLVTGPVGSVPLPAGLVLLASGMAGLGLMRRKRG